MRNILLSALAILFLSGISRAQTEQRTSVEKVLSRNPGLTLVSFEGDSRIRTRLENLLYLCGWFKPASSSGAADVRVLGRFHPNGELETYVEGLGKAFSTRHPGKPDGSAVYATVDEILARLFGVRALCTCKILFVLPGSNGMKELYSCYLDGLGQERVTHNDAISTEPEWGHSGAFVYTLAKNHALKVVLVDTVKHRQRIISAARGLNSSAALFHDGSRMALPLSIDGQVDLYAVSLKGDGRRIRLTKDRNVESSPTWSPDGSRICYVSDKLGVPLLFVKNLSDGREIRLTKGGRECVSPDWSPLCNKICFSMRTAGGQRVLALVDMADASGKITVLTDADGDWESPSWGPDGRHVVCTRSTENGKFRDLYIIDTWSGEFRAVSKGSRLALPAWQPCF